MCEGRKKGEKKDEYLLNTNQSNMHASQLIFIFACDLSCVRVLLEAVEWRHVFWVTTKEGSYMHHETILDTSPAQLWFIHTCIILPLLKTKLIVYI